MLYSHVNLIEAMQIINTGFLNIVELRLWTTLKKVDAFKVMK